MVVDQDHRGDITRKIGEEDKEMLPSQPAHLSTPSRNFLLVKERLLAVRKLACKSTNLLLEMEKVGLQV